MVKRIEYIILILLFAAAGTSLQAQSTGESLPGGYRDFQFGDSLDTVKQKLKYDSYFAYRGDPDVSMMLTPDRSIIDTAGSGFIERAYFLFNNEKLYQISLVLNRDKIDFYSFQTLFTAKYGEPGTLDPTGMIWEDEKYRLSLEYPLTVKYVDLTVFNSLLEQSQLRKSGDQVLREDFLGTF